VPAPVIRIWRRLRLTPPRYRDVCHYESRVDFPEELHPRTLALVGPTEHPKWAVFECPCGRGHQLSLSLQKSHDPHWRVTENGARINLHPSVDSHQAFRCHFWIRDGRVRWVKD
jgi:Family of unknown function (DUF6527)